MAPLDPFLRSLIDELANALQVAVLLTQHVERASATTAQDAATITSSLDRATAALQKLRTARGGP